MIPHVFGALASRFIPAAAQTDAPPALGDIIGEGYFGTVYADPHNAGKVIKTPNPLHGNVWPDAQEECELFNRYYGDNTAELIQHGRKYYLRMDRLPGEQLNNIDHFPQGAENFFFDTVREMENKGIFHSDLKPDNVLYCAERNRFYPIDFSNNMTKNAVSPQHRMSLEDNYQFRVNAIASLIMHGSVEIQRIDQAPPLGDAIGYGDDAKVYRDSVDSGYLWKQFFELNLMSEQKAQQEASAFNRYYGPGAAQVQVHGRRSYIKMRQVPGVPLKNVAVGGMHEKGVEALFHLYSALANAKIMHGDLYDENLCYERDSNCFYPIDIQNRYYEYFMGDNTMKTVYNATQQQMHDRLIAAIQSRIVPSAQPTIVDSK